MNAIDLFAGVGWDIAARELGVDPLGIEWDADACATREALGMKTLQADVAALDPMDFAPCELLIASPPCQAFSRAGNRDGMKDLPLVWAAARRLATGAEAESVEWLDERAALVTEPLRWALALEPELLAWEQVPDVLPFWEFCAEILRDKGYSVWAGLLHAECYGVPQTRQRAFLMASTTGVVEPPRATHQRYVYNEPARHDVTLEGEVLPWISMEQALGWDADVPAPTVTAGGGDTGGVEVFGRGGRQRIRRSSSQGGAE